MPTIAPDALGTFATAALAAAGLSEEHARSVSGGIVEANLRGVDSHGAVRIPQYERSIAAGEINPAPRVEVVVRRGSTALVDADGGYGFAPTALGIDEAVAIATAHGVGMVGVRNSHHFGMGAPYVERAAAAGMIGFLTTTSAPVMAPTGGAGPVVGNNPVAWAVPRRSPEPPVVLDMALSQVAYGRLRLAVADGRPIPLGWALDERGRPTTDAEAALAARLLMPMGDYKGYGLAVIGEILGGILTGSPFGLSADAHGRRSGGVGHLLMAIDPTIFTTRDRFESDVEQLVGELRGAPLAEGVDRILLPGEPERAVRAARLAGGIPISGELAETLDRLAGKLGLAGPSWMPG